MGGTDLFTQMRDGVWRPRVVVDVKHIPGMQDITMDPGGLTVGAAVTMNQLARHPAVQRLYPALAQAASSVGSFQLRNRATLGGNLCNASPCADTAPAVAALEAILVLSGPAGQRETPFYDFVLGPGRTVVGTDEFLIGIRFPAQPAGSAGCYLKLGRSRMGDLSVVGVAVVAFRDLAARSGYRFRLALGSVAPVALRVPAAESLLAAEPPHETNLAAAADLAMHAAVPISDVRATAIYQTLMVRTLTLRALESAWAQLQGAGR
jgi:carbon-monoxide dehydrogenase medium subunit